MIQNYISDHFKSFFKYQKYLPAKIMHAKIVSVNQINVQFSQQSRFLLLN